MLLPDCGDDEVLHRTLRLQLIGIFRRLFARFEATDLYAVPSLAADFRLDDSGFYFGLAQPRDTIIGLRLVRE